MYNKENTIVDRREMLRIKLKSLAEEAKIIRKEERKTFGILRNELHTHRVRDVRRAARETHIAYGLILGRQLEQIEPGRTELEGVDSKNIEKMLRRYGPPGGIKLPSSKG